MMDRRADSCLTDWLIDVFSKKCAFSNHFCSIETKVNMKCIENLTLKLFKVVIVVFSTRSNVFQTEYHKTKIYAFD